MPHLRIETNVPKAKVPADLVKRLVPIMADLLGKPVNYICVTICPDAMQSWGGTDEPSAMASVMSIGQLGTKENIQHSKKLFEIICKELGVSPERMYIHFQDAKSSEVGYQGTTFYEIFGG